MPMSSRLNRMVSFRLSEEEYEQVIRVVSDGSARSVSDIARMAMNELISHGIQKRDGNLLSRVGQLEQEMEQLKNKLAGLTKVAGAGH